MGRWDVSLVDNSSSGHEEGPLTPNPSPPSTGARGEEAQQAPGDSELRKQKAGSEQAPATTGKKPNIVFILVDNIGWGDFGCYGGMTPTPHIDALARSGIRFKNYNVEGQCTATRSAILTGRMPVRSGTCTIPAPGEGVYGLCPWEYTLAELFSEAGYATAMYGKWHLGEVTGRLPTEQGFDRWWGIKNSWEEAGYSSYPLFNALIKQSRMMPPQVWEGLKGELSTPAMPLNLETRPTMCQKVTEHTTAYIAERAAAGKPFFAYVGYPEMHPPVMPHPDFLGKSSSGPDTYSAMLREMDFRVGQILDAIQKAGIEDNTIVILSSDNASGGAAAYLGGSNGPWRGNFFTPPFEGSLRSPGADSLAGQDSCPCRHGAAVRRPRLAAHSCGPDWRLEPGTHRQADGRPRCLPVHARAKQDHRARRIHGIRHGIRTNVPQVAALQDRVPLLRGHRQTDPQAAAPPVLRSEQRSPRGP